MVGSGISYYPSSCSHVPRPHKPLGKLLDSAPTIDFALVPLTRPCQSVDARICKPDQALSKKSVVVFLGMRATEMDTDGSTLSSQERKGLTRIATRHLCVMQARLRKLSQADVQVRVVSHGNSGNRGRSGNNPNYILFATYLKAGYLYIVAFEANPVPQIKPCSLSENKGMTKSKDISANTAKAAFVDDNQSYDVTMIVLDRLPLSMRAETTDALVNRLRLAMAVSTLQQHVFRFCKSWNRAQWQAGLTAEQSRVIREAMSIYTLSPSDAGEIKTNQALLEMEAGNEEVDAYLDVLERVQKGRLTWWKAKKINAIRGYRDSRSSTIETLTAMTITEAWVKNGRTENWRLESVLNQHPINETELYAQYRTQKHRDVFAMIRREEGEESDDEELSDEAEMSDEEEEYDEGGELGSREPEELS